MARKASKQVAEAQKKASFEKDYSKFFQPNSNAVVHANTAAFHIFTTVDYRIPTYNSDRTKQQ